MGKQITITNTIYSQRAYVHHIARENVEEHDRDDEFIEVQLRAPRTS